jgi:hypothetical protein
LFHVERILRLLRLFHVKHKKVGADHVGATGPGKGALCGY